MIPGRLCRAAREPFRESELGRAGARTGVVWEGFLQEEGTQASLVGEIGCPRRVDYSYYSLRTYCVPGTERMGSLFPFSRGEN